MRSAALPNSSGAGALAARAQRFWKELSRLPTLACGVVPALWLARRRNEESLVAVLERQVRERPTARALHASGQWLDYAELGRRVTRASSWLVQRGIRPGDVLALIGASSADYVALVLGAARVGATAALVSPALRHAQLARAMERVAPRLVLADARLPSLLDLQEAGIRAHLYGDARWSLELESAPPASVASEPSGAADFVYIYTSGTTGMPKAARVTNRRALVAATSFGRLVHELRPDDIVYCALPLCHSSALLLGLGACLVTGTPLVLREEFSASAFLDEVRQHGATVFLYVGELGRALCGQPESPRDREHRLRLAVGNGLSTDVWQRLQRRFGIREVREFYAATEFPGAIVNLTGVVGAVGQIALERARGYRLVRVDSATLELIRDDRGRAIECRPGEAGELVLRLRPRPNAPAGDYVGYVGEGASEVRLARDLFRKGDVFCRSGDLMRRDRIGNYWFVDRLGDTFRFKGENVSTREVEEALSGLPNVTGIAVVGTRIPGLDGQPGLAIIETPLPLDCAALASKARVLASFQRPCFVRVVRELTLTASLKVRKRELALAGVSPDEVSGPLYYWTGETYAPLTPAAWRHILRGEVRF